MKRFEFSLDRLLNMKRQLVRIAEAQLLKAKQELEAAQQHLLTLQEQLAQVSHTLSARVGQTMAPANWVQAYEYSDRLGQAITQATRMVVEASDRFEIASRERSDLATETEALETLRKQQFDLWKQELIKKEQDRMDEFSQRQWMAAQPPSSPRAA